MKRSGGVTASAVLAIIGSVFTILIGGFAILGALLMRTMPNLPTTPAQPVPPVAFLLAESVLFLSFGVWGLASAVGLLRLKNWARVSFLVFAGLLCLVSAFGALFMLLFLVVGLPLPPQQNVPPGLMTSVFATMIVFALLHLALSVWWLFYFNRRDVKGQFMGEAAAAAPSRRPLSITIVAWLLIVGGIGAAPVYLFASSPLFVFGFVIRGWLAGAIYSLLVVAGLLAGVGLLRMKAAAHSLAVGYYGFQLLNLTTNILIPGSFARMLAVMKETVPPTPETQFFLSEQFFWSIMFFSLLAVGLPFWFLITRRQAFLDAVKARPAPTPGPSSLPGSPV